MEFNISISGPTGAGKTTFSNIVCKRKNFDLISENIPFDLFNKFKKKPYKYCFELQKTIMQTRVESFLNSNKNIKIFDRTVSEDFEVFITMHNKLGFLSNSQMEALSTISNLAKKTIGEINLTVFINSNLSCLRQRIENKFTPKFIVQNLEMQLQLYENWKNNIQTDLIEINNSYFSIGKFQKMADSFYQTLYLGNTRNLTYKDIIKSLTERISAIQMKNLA